MTTLLPFTTDCSLETLSDDIVFTQALLQQYPFASEYVASYKEMLARCDAVITEQRNFARAIVKCQAGIEAADCNLDPLIDRVDLAAAAVTGKNRQDPLYKSIFGDWRVSDLKRPLLGEELETVRAWPNVLVESGDEALSALAPIITKAIDVADKAIQALADAHSASRQFRLTGNRKKFIDDLNKLRADTFEHLRGYVRTHPQEDLPTNLASQFFQRSRKVARLTIEDLDAEISALQDDLNTLGEQRAELAAPPELKPKARADAGSKGKKS